QDDCSELILRCSGEVDTADNAGVLGAHGGFAPLWYFLRQTSLTKPGNHVRALVQSLSAPYDDTIAKMHALSELLVGKVSYEIGTTSIGTTAEEALSAGRGVCQDHAHAFISAARVMELPARYVSGYLMMDDRIDQDASHAWAEVHCGSIGWVGFDVSNGISPDERYVRVATGLDYRDAAPISGVRTGVGGESMHVEIQVQQ
ncbi:MAG: transglutaminase-like domain-containing protein, partial [Hyphomicrobiales bacterium]